jgi:hypothetical protein
MFIASIRWMDDKNLTKIKYYRLMDEPTAKEVDEETVKLIR